MAGLGCRFMTAFHGLAHRADAGAGDWLAVHGCGGVGLCRPHRRRARSQRRRRRPRRRKLALAEELGADETLNAAAVDDVPAAVQDLIGRGADVSMDALGIAETCQNAVNSLGPMGSHVQIGLTTSEEGGQIPLPTDEMVTSEVDFHGALGMPPADYDEIFRMVATGKLDPAAVVSETIGLEDVSDTLDAMTNFDTVGIPVVDSF